MLPRPGGDRVGAHHGVGGQLVADPAVDAVGDERLDHGHQPVPGQVADRVRARLERRDRGRVVRVDAGEHLAALEAGVRDGLRVVAGEPVVELEHRAGQTAAVHRADDDLVVQRAEQQQVLEDVRGAEHAVHAGPRQRQHQPVEQVDAVAHGERAAAGGAARRGPGGRRRSSSAGRGRRAARWGGGASPRPRRSRRAGSTRVATRSRKRWSSTCGLLDAWPRPRPRWASRRRTPAAPRRSHRRRCRTACSAPGPTQREGSGTGRRRTRRPHPGR